MPLDEIARGCLEVVFRTVLELIGEGLIRGLWAWVQFVGSLFAYPFTLGRIWLCDRHEILAGLLGIGMHAVIVTWAVRFFTSEPGVAL